MWDVGVQCCNIHGEQTGGGKGGQHIDLFNLKQSISAVFNVGGQRLHKRLEYAIQVARYILCWTGAG